MELFFSQFHLIRPYWLLALIPAIILFVFLLKRRLASARWNGIIDSNLMPHVLDQMPSEQSRWPLWFVLLAWLLACIALAGPTWQQLPQPVQKKDDALVIVLDMSLSMAAQDVSPDRATRARQKVIDILKQREEGLTAMVVYAGDAYTVTPLTDDADTIINLVPALSPFIMPAMGSRPDKALTLANKLVSDSGLNRANFLLITDGIQKKDIKRIKKALGKKSASLSVLTIGTEEGAPIAMQGQGFKRDKNGDIVLPKLDIDLIKELSSELNIRWHQMSFDDQDWHYLLQMGSSLTPSPELMQNSKAHERQFDLWADQGYWFIMLIIIIAAFSFRRGWMLSLVFIIGLQPEQSMASFWDDLWQTKDQQGQKIFEQDPGSAADVFEDSNWKASSHYRAGDYEQAAEHFITDDDASLTEQASSHFNRGNALAHAGELEKSIAAYEQALEIDEAFSDAKFNKQLVEELLKQQQEQQQEQENQEQQDSDKQDSDEQQNSEQENSDQQDSEQQDSQQQDSDQQQQDSDNQSQQSDSQEDSQQESQEESQNNPAEENDSDKDESDKQKSEQAEEDNESEESQAQKTEATQGEQAEDDLTREERQALKQWLNRIPDDPGGLLKRKFLYQYKQREHQDEGEVSW
mgnify:FL=1